MKTLHLVVFPLVVVGGINWGLVGLLNYNLVEMLLGSWPGLVKLVYILVGLSSVYLLATHTQDCKTCGSMMKGK